MNNDILNILKNSNNPQAMLNTLVQQRMGNNPIGQSLISMMNSNNSNGIETLARNICKEKGIDPDALMKQVQGNFK